MSADGALARDVTARQIQMFAMFVGPGLLTTRAALSAASGVPDSTLKSWAAGAAMPFHGVLTLRRYLPAAAINMLSEPGGARLVDFEKSKADWDAIAADASGLVSDVCEARRDGIINHVEDARLRGRARALVAELSEVIETG
jgi:hypothetical protein